MDNSQFVRGKGPILTEYLRTRKKIGDGVAAKGFTFEPGFMYDIQNDLETDTKFKLSELNYTILEEAVKRRLRQDGQDYDLAHRNAVISWESDKAVLLTDWDRELIAAKRARADDEEAMRILEIQLNRRGTLLLEAKTIIERDAEALKRQIAELDGSTGDLEVQVANAKLLSAQKRLELIPYIQQIIDIERQIIGKDEELVELSGRVVEIMDDIVDVDEDIVTRNQEIVDRQNAIVDAELDLIAVQLLELAARQNKIAEETTLVTAEESAVNYRISVVEPALTALTEKMDEYVAELAVQQALYDEISTEKIELADLKSQQADKAYDILAKKVELATAVTELVTLTEGLYTYKESNLMPAISELVDAYQTYITDIGTQAALKVAIAQVRSSIAAIGEHKASKQVEIGLAKIDQETQRAVLSDVALEIDNTRSINALDMAQTDSENTVDRVTEKDQARSEITTRKDQLYNMLRDLKTQIQETRLDIDLTNQTTFEESRQKEREKQVESDIERDQDIADIKTDSEGVTARLEHLLTQD